MVLSSPRRLLMKVRDMRGRRLAPEGASIRISHSFLFFSSAAAGFSGRFYSSVVLAEDAITEADLVGHPGAVLGAEADSPVLEAAALEAAGPHVVFRRLDLCQQEADRELPLPSWQ